MKQRDHQTLRSEVVTITLHVEQKQERERAARKRVEALEVWYKANACKPFFRPSRLFSPNVAYTGRTLQCRVGVGNPSVVLHCDRDVCTWKIQPEGAADA